MSIKAVIFDLGGVLIRTEDKKPRATLGLRFGKTYAEMDKIIFGKSAYQASIGKITEREHWQSIMRIFNLPDTEIESFYEEFFGGDLVDYTLVEYIRSLRPRYATALLSNAWDDTRGLLKNRWQIDDAFDEVFISAEIGIAKPDARIYQYALEKLGVVPEESVFVDDFIENIKTAQALGMQAIHFQDIDGVMDKLKKLLGTT